MKVTLLKITGIQFETISGASVFTGLSTKEIRILIATGRVARTVKRPRHRIWREITAAQWQH
jgi:hypothetical protein